MKWIGFHIFLNILLLLYYTTFKNILSTIVFPFWHECWNFIFTFPDLFILAFNRFLSRPFRTKEHHCYSLTKFTPEISFYQKRFLFTGLFLWLFNFLPMLQFYTPLKHQKTRFIRGYKIVTLARNGLIMLGRKRISKSIVIKQNIVKE